MAGTVVAWGGVLAFLSSALSGESLASVAPLGAPVLAMIGALAVACFAKVYGAVFLGTPRTDAALKAREAPASMLVPMAALAFLCVLIGALPALTAPILDKAIAVARGPGSSMPPAPALSSMVPIASLGALVLPAALGAATLSAFFFWRARRVSRQTVTWDCGYARPTARVQYTAGSFARTLVGLFGWALKSRVHVPRVSGFFPERSALESHVDDPVLDRQLIPDAAFLRSRVRWFNRFQQGQTQSYILYVVVALGLILATLIPFKRLFLSLFVR